MPNPKDKSDIGTNARDIDIVIETEHGNKIAFVDESFECGKKDDGLDDYAWSQCGAMSLAGDPDDEVLVIESGNRRKIRSSYGPQSPPGTVTEVAGDSNSRGGGWSAATVSDWKGAEGRSSWGTHLSQYQNAGCKYKEHVVRRELVHGSYEEHIEGDMYTTIEGTWISKIKGNIWDTFYGFCHEDFNEHFEEVFYSTKSEVQKGNIVEYNYGESYEYYYGKVVNEYGTPEANVDVTEKYYGSVYNEVHCEGGGEEYRELVYGGPKTSIVFGNNNDMVFGANTDAVFGNRTDITFATAANLFLAFVLNLGASVTLNIASTKIAKGLTWIETVDAVKMSQTQAAKIARAGIQIDTPGMYLIS
ncbi:MAG: hypothetical protein JSV86_06325 [Gemmatimonadota bacterium]|nr:MAG: hypothetical protein JSV86_06325 [Gemmatimonadota bacterium]